MARFAGSDLVNAAQGSVASEKLRGIFKGKLIAAGGFEPASAQQIAASGTVDAVAFGRYFASNPDLPLRLCEGLPLSPYDLGTFYTFDEHGYTGMSIESLWGDGVRPHFRKLYAGTLMLNVDISPERGERLLRSGLGEMIASAVSTSPILIWSRGFVGNPS